jgi:hypothetical protein
MLSPFYRVDNAFSAALPLRARLPLMKKNAYPESDKRLVNEICCCSALLPHPLSCTKTRP